jgi:hypothetical protein
MLQGLVHCQLHAVGTATAYLARCLPIIGIPIVGAETKRPAPLEPGAGPL